MAPRPIHAQAAIVLGGLKESDIKQVGKDLIDALGTEKESRVRREIAIGLSRHQFLAKAGVANLTNALKDPEPATLMAVADALAQAGSDAKSAAASLVPMLHHSKKGLRRAAVRSPLGSRLRPKAQSRHRGDDGAHARDRKGPRHAGCELLPSLGLLGEKSGVVIEEPSSSCSANLTGRGCAEQQERTLGTFGDLGRASG